MGAVAAGNVVLNLLLIPWLGYTGAAVSTIVSYGMLALIAGRVSQRYYRVPWDLPRVGALLAIAGGLSAAALLGPDHVGWRLACIAAYPALVIGLRIVPHQVLAPLARFARRS